MLVGHVIALLLLSVIMSSVVFPEEVDRLFYGWYCLSSPAVKHAHLGLFPELSERHSDVFRLSFAVKMRAKSRDIQKVSKNGQRKTSNVFRSD